MARVLAAVLVLLALTGCTTATAPRAGLNADEVDRLRLWIRDSNWTFSGLSDDLRPAPQPVTTLSYEDWASAYVKCMNIAGFDNYHAITGGGYETGDTLTDAPSDDELLADYTCQSRFEIEGQFDGWFNNAQLGYLYDYYRQSLVPCMEVLGYEVTTPPTRTEFTNNWGGWHPYFAMSNSQLDALMVDDRVLAECPPTPAGVPDPGYASMWQQ